MSLYGVPKTTVFLDRLYGDRADPSASSGQLIQPVIINITWNLFYVGTFPTLKGYI